jgi:hypothetical protein
MEIPAVRPARIECHLHAKAKRFQVPDPGQEPLLFTGAGKRHYSYGVSRSKRAGENKFFFGAKSHYLNQL